MNPVIQEETREIIKEIEILDSLQASRKKKNGLDYYIPNQHQLRAHQSKARTILVCGANRIGKSTLGAVELCMHLTHQYKEYVPYERRFHRPIKAVVVCLENQIIEKVIEPKIREYIQASKVDAWKRLGGGYLNRLIMKDGSTCDFLTNEQDDMAFEGADWDFFWGDEPQRKRKFEAIKRGLVDRRGQAIITFTPLIEPWMKQELVDKSDGINIETITADMRDNLTDIKGNKILSEEAIREFETSLPDDVRETRVHGKFFHLRGIVYSEFSDIHCLDEINYQYPDPVICVLDPHDRQPHHVIWAIINRTDDIFIHSEISIHCTVQELAILIKKTEKSNGYNVRRRFIDPNFGRKPLITTGRNMIQELSISGCNGWLESDDAKDEGRLKVKQYLHYDKRFPISHTNTPKLFFLKSRVPLTINSIRNHQYEDWIGKLAGERDPKEKPKDKETHGADCVRYLCMSNPNHEKLKGSPIYELEESPY